MNKPENPVLNHKLYESAITEQPEFLESVEKNEPLRRAVGRGALAAAERMPSYGFQPAMLSTIGNLENYVDAQNTIDGLRQKNGATNANRIPDNERDAYYESRETITHFNHVLRETIESSINEGVSFAELQKFLTEQHIIMSGERNVKKFSNMIHSTINGMRNEIAVEMILIKNGVEFDQGSEEDDSKGGDFIVNGVPIDIKSSEKTTMHKRAAAERNGYPSEGIIWSQIEFEDFAGKLGLDEDTEARVAANLLPEIDKAAGTNYAQASVDALPA